MMRPDTKVKKVFLYPRPVDFRKSIDGLSALVELEMTVSLFEPSIFVFLNRARNRVVDGMSWREYEEGLLQRINNLHAKLHSGAYRATPSRRVYIPKADGKQRPLGIASLEDKIVQQAVVTVLNAIYEEDFLGFSGVFVWVPTGTQPARCVGRVNGRAEGPESELDIGKRY